MGDGEAEEVVSGAMNPTKADWRGRYLRIATTSRSESPASMSIIQALYPDRPVVAPRTLMARPIFLLALVVTITHALAFWLGWASAVM